MMIQKIINQIKSGGYSHVKNIFDVKTCNSIASYLENMDASIKIPFSSVPWGYGNLINNPNLADIYLSLIHI